MALVLSDLARISEQLLTQGVNNLGPFSIGLVFLGGFLTSLGPCSLSLLPITISYLAGFNNKLSPINRSIAFCGGIVLSLILLGILSSLVGKVYGQTPYLLTIFVALLAVMMGLNLIGIISLPLPTGPDPKIWEKKVPTPLSPIAAGFAFGLAASPCTTPVLAVLLAWIAKIGNPLTGSLFLAAFGIGQVIPLLIAGAAAGSIPKLLALRPISKWIQPLSGLALITIGFMTLIAQIV